MQINRILKLSQIWHVNSINPQNNRDLYQVIFGTSGPNLVILAETGDELLRRQAQNGASFDFEVKFGLEGQGQSPPKIIGILTTLFYTYGQNLLILARRVMNYQAVRHMITAHTDRHTDRCRQRQYSKAKTGLG